MRTARVKPEPVYGNAELYRNKGSHAIPTYNFPLRTTLHPDYGRMEVRVEPVVAQGKINRLILQFRQHEIEELKNEFMILTPQADKHTGLSTHAHSSGSFFRDMWMVMPCREHKSLVLCTYVPDGMHSLWIQLLTTAIYIGFKEELCASST